MPRNLEDVYAALTGLTVALKEGARIVVCPAIPIAVPGIGAGAHAAGDCLGTIRRIRVPKRGIIYSATFWDLDDEGSQVDLEIFRYKITQIADDAAWAPSDADMEHFVAELAFVAFDDHINNQTSDITNIGKAYVAPEGLLYVQAVCRGTPTIVTAPLIQLQILSGDPDWRE